MGVNFAIILIIIILLAAVWVSFQPPIMKPVVTIITTRVPQLAPVLTVPAATAPKTEYLNPYRTISPFLTPTDRPVYSQPYITRQECLEPY